MKTNISTQRWIFLLYLCVVIIATIQVDSYAQVNVGCCRTVHLRRFKRIEECREQMKRSNCKVHAFLIKPTKNTNWQCINPNSPGLQSTLRNKNISCPPAVELNNNNHTG